MLEEKNPLPFTKIYFRVALTDKIRYNKLTVNYNGTDNRTTKHMPTVYFTRETNTNVPTMKRLESFRRGSSDLKSKCNLS